MSTSVLAHRIGRRSRPLIHAATHHLRSAARPIASGLRRVPLPHPVRVTMSTVLLRRPGLVEIPLSRILLGMQDGINVSAYAAQFDDLMWGSTPVTEGPHAQLLREADGAGAHLSDQAITSSWYGEHARRCLQLRGRYFWATDEAGIVDVARSFLARRHSSRYDSGAAMGPASNGSAPQVSAPVPTRTGQSGPNDPILVAPIRDSDCYQLIDGHHRAALLAHAGSPTARVSVKRFGATTPLQELLNRMSWLGGTKELYQPLDAPELSRSWVTVRRCMDRLEKMREVVAEHGLTPGPTDSTTSYLDVASCYGWFVHQMVTAGYDATGIERDPLARELGRGAYGVSPARIRIGDATDILATDERWDVVSCFSLLHHFVLGRAPMNARELLGLLDRVTGRVLFVDTGQEHETWFARSLRGWNPDSIRTFLAENTTFDEIVDLGPDADAVGHYADNYGRHLFACVRTG